MDISLLTAALTGIKTSYEMGVAAVGLRDANKIASAVSQINDQLLKDRENLILFSEKLMVMKEQLMHAQEENRELKAAAKERSNYALVKLASGNFVLQSKVDVNEASTEPMHYVCQPCFDFGRKAVLQPYQIYVTSDMLRCPLCKDIVKI